MPIADLLLAAAHSDGTFCAQEEAVVRRLLRQLLGVDRLPDVLDERVRTFISRRNTNMAMITVAVVYEWATGSEGAAAWTFYFVILWQLACLVWHAERLVRFWGDGRKKA